MQVVREYSGPRLLHIYEFSSSFMSDFRDRNLGNSVTLVKTLKTS